VSIPSEALATALEASGALSDGISIYPGPAPQIVPPAIVIRPAEPWIEPSTFCDGLERYHAIAVVTAATPRDGVAELYIIIQAIRDALVGDPGSKWDWESVGQPVIDESTGTAFLAAPVRLTYREG